MEGATGAFPLVSVGPETRTAVTSAARRDCDPQSAGSPGLAASGGDNLFQPLYAVNQGVNALGRQRQFRWRKARR